MSDLQYKTISLGDDGRDGSIMVYSKPKKQELFDYSVEIPYRWGLAGPHGAWFTLFRDPNVTDTEIEAAKRCLRNSQDVAELHVERRN